MTKIIKSLSCLLFFASFLFVAVPSFAQKRTCGAMEVYERRLKSDPQFRAIREQIERHRQQFNSESKARERTVITIPVVFNVVWHEAVENVSDAQIFTQLDVLNADFRALNADIGNVPQAFSPFVADCEINFCLAKQDPDGNPTTGIRRRETDVPFFTTNDDVKFTALGGLDAWDRDRYLNIWVCPLREGLLGYSSFPGEPAATDGVVCGYLWFGTIGTATPPYDKGRTCTHEIGHWLDLIHIWGNDGSACSGSDLVEDTPNQADENYFCPEFPNISCNNGPNGDMFMNYMDYVYDECMYMFTQGQKSRIQPLFGEEGFRSPLLDSPACQCPCTEEITHINQNTTYATDRRVPGDIIVHSGHQLTIYAKVELCQDARIIVERNARLVIHNGGIVTRGCDAPDWGGIQVLGHSSNTQPNYNGPLTNPYQSGIVWVNYGAVVEWARCGILAGDETDSQFSGGVVWTVGARFRNNQKDVEFLPFTFLPNKSRFFSSQFYEEEGSMANTEGVIIRETNGIEFYGCTFTNKDFEGIRTYDAAVGVFNGSGFTDNQTGVSAFATYPMANTTKIGSALGAENNFNNNTYHIHASLSTGFFGQSNGKFSLDVIHNNFSGGTNGVIVDGSSNFRIGGNHFTEVPFGNLIVNTGFNNPFNQNFVGCNRFEQGSDWGILGVGENKYMEFLANDFNLQSTGNDFILTHSFFPILPGAIKEMQGNDFAGAENCFTNPIAQNDILTWGNTDHFRYYHYENDAFCNHEPLTLGNYTKQKITQSHFGVDCSRYGGLPDGLESPTQDDLDDRRDLLQQLLPNIGSSPSARAAYYQTLLEKEAVLKYLLQQALENEAFTVAENLLAGEQSKAADWAIFGLRMARLDTVAAANWLDQMLVQNAEDAQFKAIQQINLQRLKNPDAFQLSIQQEGYLTSVAESSSPIRGYARGLLGLLKNRRFYPDTYDFDESGQAFRSSGGKIALENSIRVAPVPASTAMTVSWTTLPEDATGRLKIFDVIGNQYLDEQILPFENRRTLYLEHLPNGVYLLMIADKGNPVHSTKFIIQR